MDSAFGEFHPPEHASTWTPLLDPGRSLMALDGEDRVGGVTVAGLDLTVPGGQVPAGCVLGAAVLPTHRRRGLLRAMMVRQLHDMHEREEALSVLWASESSIYGRFGYGPGTLSAHLEIDPARSAFVPQPEATGRLRLVEAEAAFKCIQTVYERVRAIQVGAPERTPEWWRHIFDDREHRRNGFSPLVFVLYESGPAALDGYAVYRLKEKELPGGLPGNLLALQELMAATDEAYRALWRYSLDVDLLAEVRAENRPPDEPLLYLLADARRLRVGVVDGLWIRLVDVPAALGGRRYRSGGTVILAVHDEVCPWNEGRFRLEGDPDGAGCRPVHEAPDLELEARDLAAAYLGTASFHSLARAGRVAERTPGSLARADAMFRWDPAPWCPNVL